MKAFVVHVNGKQLFTAGIGADGVLTAIVNWVGRSDPSPHCEFNLHVTGIDGRSGEFLSYPTPPIGVGDSISVQIIDTEDVDAADSRFSTPGSGPSSKRRSERKPNTARRKRARDGGDADSAA